MGHVTALVVPGLRQTSAPARTTRLPVPVLLAAAATLLLRLPFVGAPISSDEGGFLTVAHQWHAGGGSLYGHYWVDRPPLLIEIFRIADLLGGIIALRLIAALAATVSVVLVGYTVHRLLGVRPATWAAAVASGLLVAPMAGASLGDGEVIALPLLALGVAATVVSLTTPVLSRARWAAATAGFAAVAALLVKQNMLDVFVFAAAFGLLTWRSGHVERTRLRWLAAPWAAGTAASLILVLGVAATRGTTPGGVFFAMYPFRFEAANVITTHAAGADIQRMVRLIIVGFAFGAPVLIGAVAALLVRRRVTRVHALAVPLAGAMLAITAYAVVSIGLGGNYWLHYLVQLVLPASLATGLLVASLPRLGMRLAALATAVAAVGWMIGMTTDTSATGASIGGAIHRVSVPGDTIVSLLGDGEIVRTAGLSSPYPYLWSLPARTLDPQLSRLRQVMAGPQAPTWVVVRGPVTTAELETAGVGGVLRARYHPAGLVCDRQVFVRDDVTRAAPVNPEKCSAPFSPWFSELSDIGGHP